MQLRTMIPRIAISVTPQAVREIGGLLGIALFSYGAWLHYPPLGFIAGGVLLITGAVVGTLRNGGR